MADRTVVLPTGFGEIFVQHHDAWQLAAGLALAILIGQLECASHEVGFKFYPPLFQTLSEVQTASPVEDGGGNTVPA